VPPLADLHKVFPTTQVNIFVVEFPFACDCIFAPSSLCLMQCHTNQLFFPMDYKLNFNDKNVWKAKIIFWLILKFSVLSYMYYRKPLAIEKTVTHANFLYLNFGLHSWNRFAI